MDATTHTPSGPAAEALHPCHGYEVRGRTIAAIGMAAWPLERDLSASVSGRRPGVGGAS